MWMCARRRAGQRGRVRAGAAWRGAGAAAMTDWSAFFSEGSSRFPVPPDLVLKDLVQVCCWVGFLAALPPVLAGAIHPLYLELSARAVA